LGRTGEGGKSSHTSKVLESLAQSRTVLARQDERAEKKTGKRCKVDIKGKKADIGRFFVGGGDADDRRTTHRVKTYGGIAEPVPGAQHQRNEEGRGIPSIRLTEQAKLLLEGLLGVTVRGLRMTKIRPRCVIGASPIK